MSNIYSISNFFFVWYRFPLLECTVKSAVSLQEVAEYYSKHTQSPQRWHTPKIIEDLKVCKDIFVSFFFPNFVDTCPSYRE